MLAVVSFQSVCISAHTHRGLLGSSVTNSGLVRLFISYFESTFLKCIEICIKSKANALYKNGENLHMMNFT